MMKSHIVSHTDQPQRLSDYLVGVFPQLPSRKSVKKAIKKGLIQVDGRIGSTGLWVEEGMEISLCEEDIKPPKVYQFPLEVILEDDYLAVINKPGGVVVSGNQFRTVENALPANLMPSTKIDALQRFRPVHRLDAATCGLLLVAKTKLVRMNLGQQLEERLIKKQYQAIVMGKPPTDAGVINEPISGKTSFTEYEVLQVVPSLKVQQLSWLRLRLHTGRTHQLRIHLSQLGCPILGDSLYHGEFPILKGKGLFLCATQLIFNHPITQKEIKINIQPPRKFAYRMQQEKRRWQRWQDQHPTE